jgi:VIT1/CCC1 family predicted Fe2+/Mn2+ transporter
VGAKAGGAGMLKASLRVVFWGAFAMAVTAGIGAIFGTRI